MQSENASMSAPVHAVVSTRVKVGDVVIFQRPDGEWFDGNVLSVWDDGVNVVYLEGYKSRGPDRVEWNRIRARVDSNSPHVDLGDVPYKGHFEVFSSC
ncbi:hypothetical protein [Rubripirellula reticaptiva]|uniref:Uncharacterized protein n=1 Tax=Rubripirellula reticaptiva TaxID=2528013 RepID=A0A5C6ERB3_9BACT|nr:hypothetical protein [Rubripirellula reticaptiva]TWU51478.1 hypothetical protein Poly59_30700 [Rubripirellula reticaptiva]